MILRRAESSDLEPDDLADVRARYGGFLAVAAGALGRPSRGAGELAGSGRVLGVEADPGRSGGPEALDTLAGGVPGDR
jgi:hypothetical protein